MGTVTPPARSLRRAGLLVGPASLVANLIAYALSLVLARLMTGAEFGAASAMLAIVLVGAVPGTALQQVSARRIARAPDPAARAQLAHDLVKAGLAAGTLTAAVTLVVSPLLERFLHLPSAASLWWLALVLLALTTVNSMQGILQGAEHFSALSFLFLVSAVLRFVGMTGGALVRPDVVGAMAGLAAGTVASTAVAAVLTLREPRSAGHAASGRRRVSDVLVEVSRAAGGLAGFLLLANLDLLLARHYLPRADSGAYAVGSLVTKAALFGPAFVTIIVFARLTDPLHRRRTLQLAVGFLGALGAAGVLAVWLGGRPALALAFGESYAFQVADVAWLFALFGVLLVVAQLLLYAGIAVRSGGFGWVMVGAAVIEAAVVATVAHDSMLAVITTATVCTGGLVAIGAVVATRD